MRASRWGTKLCRSDFVAVKEKKKRSTEKERGREEIWRHNHSRKEEKSHQETAKKKKTSKVFLELLSLQQERRAFCISFSGVSLKEVIV